jgi:hypothetical protein
VLTATVVRELAKSLSENDVTFEAVKSSNFDRIDGFLQVF